MSFWQNAKTALRVFKSEQTFSKSKGGLRWLDLADVQPEWHTVDLRTYFEEGFTVNSLIYSAIMYKVRATLTAPLRAYTGNSQDPVLLDVRHPLSVRLAHPNPHQSWPEFHSRNIMFFNLAGNVYIYTEPETGDMFSLRPDRVYIVADPNSLKYEPVPRLLGFIYVPRGKSPKTGIPILAEDMLHIKLPNPLDEWEGIGYGLSPLSSAARAVDVDNMITNFLNVFFKKGGMITGLLRFDMSIKPTVADQILERWETKYGGYEKWRTGILDRGGIYQRVGLTVEEMGFAEVDSRSESRVLGPFGIPPILIGAKLGLERSTYSNYEAAREAAWEDTLAPELAWFEAEYQHKFGTDDIFVTFDTSRVPALQKGMIRKVKSAYTLCQIGVPRDLALRTAGINIGSTPGGDQSVVLTGRGVQQGSRANPDNDSWGQRPPEND